MRQNRNAQDASREKQREGRRTRKQILDNAESRVVRTLLSTPDLISISASGPRLMMIDFFFVSPPSRS